MEQTMQALRLRTWPVGTKLVDILGISIVDRDERYQEGVVATSLTKFDAEQ